MPPIETDDLLQTAVVWPCTGYTGYGEPSFGTPYEVDVRWIKRTRQSVDPQGNTVTIEGDAVVEVAPPINSLMREGTLDNWYGTDGGTGSAALTVDNGLMQVKTIEVTPDIKARVTRTTLGLMRFRDKPTGG